MNPEKLLLESSSLDTLELPVFIKNNDGIYVYCNQALVNFLGIPKNKIIGSTAYDIAPRKLADVYVNADKLLFNTAENQKYDANVKTGVISETRVTFNKAVIYTPQHQIAGFIGSIDIKNEILSGNGDLLNKLTKKENKVLLLLAQGKSVKVIAQELSISSHTVTHHLKSIYSKLDAHSKNEAIYKALTLLSVDF